MEKRLELEMRGRAPGEIVTLTLDNCRTTQVAGITDEFVKLENLSLINVGLTTLKGFPSLPALKKLELSDNRISGGLEHLAGCPNLVTLNLSGNKIKDLAVLEPLKELKNLKTLDLYNCEVTRQNNFRWKVYEMIPHLCYLDGFDRQEVEAAESESADDDDEDDELDGDVEDEEEESEDEEADDEDAGDEEDEDETEDFEPEEEEESKDKEDNENENENENEDEPEERGIKRKFDDESSN